ncbi:MAG: TonB-dependent receptor [Burkholderiaceae bacterium]
MSAPRHRLAERLLCAVLAAPVPALAQPPAGASSTLDPVLVTGTRVPLTLGQETDSVTVIERAQIERLGASSGVDLFRQVPGLQIDQLGGPGGLSSVYIRGSDPNHVLVLIDGVRVNDPTNSRGGGFDMSSLDPSQIERIEVLRGTASAIYGADAMGGVINIITRRARPGVALGAGAGGLGYRSMNARAATGGTDFQLSAIASALRDGRDADGGTLRLQQLGTTMHWAPEPRTSLDLDLRHGERRSSAFPDDSGGIELAELRTLERRKAHDNSIAARAKLAFEALTLNLAATDYRHVENIDSPGVAPGLRSDFGVPSSSSHTDYRRSNALLNAVFHGPGGSELALGGEFQREHGLNHTDYVFFGMPIPVDFDLRRDTRSGFAELKWLATPELIVRLGLRHDAIDGNGSQTSPSAGLRYALPALGGSLKASYAEGFKPPSFFALGLPVALGGNPDLRAEHSKGGALGYEQRWWAGRAGLTMSLFKTRYTDLVTFDNESNQTVNAQRVDIRGAEIEFSLQASSALSLQASFTRLISRVADSDEPLRQRPGRRAGVQALWMLSEGASLNWRFEYAADVFDSSVPTGNLTLPSYLRSDLSYAMRLRPGLNLAASVNNLFDRRNQSYVGALAPGRRALLTLDASF